MAMRRMSFFQWPTTVPRPFFPTPTSTRATFFTGFSRPQLQTNASPINSTVRALAAGKQASSSSVHSTAAKESEKQATSRILPDASPSSVNSSVEATGKQATARILPEASASSSNSSLPAIGGKQASASSANSIVAAAEKQSTARNVPEASTSSINSTVPAAATAAVGEAGKHVKGRILPDDKPLPLASLHFPWEGGDSQRSLLLLDGNAILYRAYYKIMAKVQYGSLKDMGSESDWVLTVFTALSTVIRLLEIQPSHVAAAFDYKGLTFRHELYQPYKNGRPPTPDTVCQAISCLKPALMSLGIPVVEVAGVEADDVIATFALRAVEAGMNVSIASPDKDFFQIISPQLRLLRFVPRGSGIVPFGVKEFQERFGDIQPWQYLDVLALMGDKVDNIPGLAGVGEITALKLVKEFGTVENLLENREKVKLKRPRTSLMADDGGVMLSKKLLSLRVDMPNHMLPYDLDDLGCHSPKDSGDQFNKLVDAMASYVNSSISEDILNRATELWETWDAVESAL